MKSVRSHLSILVTVSAIIGFSFSAQGQGSCEGGKFVNGPVVDSLGITAIQSICISNTYSAFLGGKLSQDQTEVQRCVPFNIYLGSVAEADFQRLQYVPLKAKDQSQTICVQAWLANFLIGASHTAQGR